MPSMLLRTVAIAGVAAVAFTGCLQESGINSSHAQTAASAPAAAPTGSTARLALPDFSSLVEQVGPAVVNISVTSVEKVAQVGGIDEQDPFAEFFRRFGIPSPNMPRGGRGENNPPQERINQGVGSGFIVSADGYVLTNAHVVAEASTVTVRLTDKREFKAKVIGSDRRTDVALIKIEATNLPTVKMGDPEQTKVGAWVLAVGSPFGFENTVTAGIVSAKARRLPDENFVPFIQTDVAINPGNSGGPLFNLNGEVIGINSQIYSRSGGFMGISFAIPIDVAMKVKNALQKDGKVSRGRLGVVIQNMDADLAQSFGLEKRQGALVSSVDPAGPAAKAGLRSGDIILQVDGDKVDDSGDLPRIIGNRSPGDTVKLQVWRDKAKRDISAKLAEFDEPGSTPKKADKEPDSQPSKLGLTLRELQAAEARRLGVAGGLVVEASGGVAARAGIQRGDVILAVGNQPLNSAEQFAKLLERAGKTVALLVQRGEQQQYVVIRQN